MTATYCAQRVSTPLLFTSFCRVQPNDERNHAGNSCIMWCSSAQVCYVGTNFAWRWVQCSSAYQPTNHIHVSQCRSAVACMFLNHGSLSAATVHSRSIKLIKSTVYINMYKATLQWRREFGCVNCTDGIRPVSRASAYSIITRIDGDEYIDTALRTVWRARWAKYVVLSVDMMGHAIR